MKLVKINELHAEWQTGKRWTRQQSRDVKGIANHVGEDCGDGAGIYNAGAWLVDVLQE